MRLNKKNVQSLLRFLYEERDIYIKVNMRLNKKKCPKSPNISI